MQRKVSVLWGEKKVVLRQTPRAVTPFGGLSVFIEFLKRIGFPERVNRKRQAGCSRKIGRWQQGSNSSPRGLRG